MPGPLPSLDTNPTALLQPDASRLRALAEGLATEGEVDLSGLVHRVADGLPVPDAPEPDEPGH